VNSKGQHIGRLFTFLAGLIILAHVVVPHDHHFDTTHSSAKESSCESSSQDENTENSYPHCHALNILVSEKANTSSLNQSLPEFFNFFSPGIIVNLEIPSVKTVTTPFFSHQAIFLKQFFFTAQSLRGPPANA